MENSYHCQNCGAVIPLEDVNVSSDIALCRTCGKTMPFSGLAPISSSSVVLQRPPEGVCIVDDPIKGKTITYRKFSPSMLLLFPMAAGFLGATIFLLFGFHIYKYKFDIEHAPLTIIAIPFLAGTVFLFTGAFFNLLGSWRITITRDQLAVSMKVGLLSWTRRLACDRSAQVRMFLPSIQVSGGTNSTTQRMIQVKCQGKTLNFGSVLPEKVILYIAEIIRRTLTGG